jgi:ankyrin repeat protein
VKKLIAVAFCALFAFVPIATSQNSSQIEQKDRQGFTPLMRAADRGEVNVVRSLLKSGAAVDGKQPGGLTALMLAARNGHLPVIKVLLAAGANPNVSVQTMEAGAVSPLIWAIMSDNQAVVQTLLKNGAEVNPRYEDGTTPLMHAVQFCGIQMVNTLLAAGANVNSRKSDNGYTALMIAAERDEPQFTRVLIDAGAEVNVKNKFGETALILARKERNTAAIAVLKRAGAKG